LIAVSRVVMATMSLLATSMHSSEPSRHATNACSMLEVYALYSGLIALLVWRSPTSLIQLQLPMHIFDLMMFPVFMYFADSPTSLFLVYVMFALICGTLRWSWRGTLWTAGAALGMHAGIGIYSADVWGEPSFELGRFIIRSIYLTVIAALLAYFGASMQRWHSEVTSLAAWPYRATAEAGTLVRQVLEHAANTLDIPRAILVWEDPEEPWCYEAVWSCGDFSLRQTAIEASASLVAAPLAGSNFLYLPTASAETVFYTSPDGLRRWSGRPLDSEWETRFGVREVLSFNLRGEILKGRLFLLDNPQLTSHAFIVGEIITRHAVAALDQFFMLQQLKHTTSATERLRLAGDLHDGLLQSLSAAVLHIETLDTLLAEASQTVRERVQDLRRLLRAEQRGLRVFIDGLKSASPGLKPGGIALTTRLEEVGERIERHWGLHVEMNTAVSAEEIPEPLAQELYFLTHEALVNAARHARGSTASVELIKRGDQVHLTVADNGRGFPFRGRFDHAVLRTMQGGPVMLRQRVESMGGSLTIDSSAAGACLEITVPLARESV
jgi:signal transduction histidine kinase